MHRCEFDSCHKQPNYGYEGQRACYCSTHKLPTMVDVKHRQVFPTYDSVVCRDFRVNLAGTTESVGLKGAALENVFFSNKARFGGGGGTGCSCKIRDGVGRYFKLSNPWLKSSVVLCLIGFVALLPVCA